jgi:hypothetical protein
MKEILSYKMRLNKSAIITVIVFSCMFIYKFLNSSINISSNLILKIVYCYLLLFGVFIWSHLSNNGLTISSDGINIINYLRFWKIKYNYKKEEIKCISIKDGTTMYYGAITITIFKLNGEHMNFRFHNLYEDGRYREIKAFLIDKGYELVYYEPTIRDFFK